MLYRIAHVVVYLLARWFFRLRIEGRDHLPRHGGVIVASNHASYLDIPLIGCAMPRRADYLGKAELFKYPGMNWFLRQLGGIPIRRNNFQRDMLREVVRRLAAGRAVVIYPEGVRTPNGQLGEARPGLGMLVLLSGAPVVPAYVKGTREAWPPDRSWFRPWPVTVRFGPPMRFDVKALRNEDDRAIYQRISRAVMQRISELGPDE